MKYIIMKNLNLIKTSIAKYYIVQLSFFVIVLVLYFSTVMETESKKIYYFLGLLVYERKYALINLNNIISFCVIMYISGKLYFEDVAIIKTLSNRINQKSLLLYNIINLELTLFFFAFLNYLCFMLFAIIKGNFLVFGILKTFFYYLLMCYCVGICMILILNLLSKKQLFLKFMIIVPIGIIITMYSFNVLNINLFILLGIIIFLMIINILIFNIKDNYERYT